MEAPEKIYLDPSDRAGEEYDAEWSVIPGVEGGIEYIRADAFIEKAERYFYLQLNTGSFECGDIEKFIKDFKNYMKE